MSSGALARFQRGLAALGSLLQPLVLLLVRVTWGYQLVESGWGHYTHIARTAAFFASLHVPLPEVSVYLSATTELLGGSLLILGLFARIVSVPLCFNFCVAYASASWPDLMTTLHQKGIGDAFDAFVNDTAFPFLVTSLLILAFGPGRIALDALIFRRQGTGAASST